MKFVILTCVALIIISGSALTESVIVCKHAETPFTALAQLHVCRSLPLYDELLLEANIFIRLPKLDEDRWVFSKIGW